VGWKSAAAAITTLGVISLMAAPAQSEVLFESGPSTFGFHPTSQDFETAFDDDDSLAADDFQVPAGEVWIVERAFVDGRKPFNSEAGTTATVNASLFANQGTLPAAAPFYSRQLIADPATPYPDFDLALPDVPLLPAGSWWLGVQPRMDFAPGSDGDGATVGSYWVWGTDAVQRGGAAAWRSPGGGGAGCTEFGLATACADTPGSDVTNPDLSFRVEGTRVDGDLAVTSAQRQRKGKLALTVNAPNLGTLAITGKAMKPVAVEVSAVGPAEVVVKPTAKTKRKLKRGKKAKASLNLTMPPYFDGTGVAPATFTKKLKR
jgi:hypothetical protein